MTRREFIASVAAFVAVIKTYAKPSQKKTFEEKLKDEVENVLKKHADEENNESTHRVIEAEINDWAHIHVVSGELDMFNVQCGSNETSAGEECWVQCLFKKHGDKEAKVLQVTVSI